MIFNGIDLAVEAVRHGRGIPRFILAFLDSAIAIAIGICVALVTVKIVDLIKTRVYYGSNYRIAVASLLTFAMYSLPIGPYMSGQWLTLRNNRLLHSFLFFSCFKCTRPSTRSRHIRQPRLLVIPSGAAVMVTSRPLPEGPAVARPSPVEMGRLRPRAARSRASNSDRDQSIDSGRMLQPQGAAISPSPPLIASESRAIINPVTANPVFESPRVARQDIPRRRPVATNASVAVPPAIPSMAPSPGTVLTVETRNLAPPPGPDYQPDDGELQRAARGEAQAQWVPDLLKGSR